MVKKKSGGHAAKDASIVDGFNTKPMERPRDPVTNRFLPTGHPPDPKYKRQREYQQKLAVEKQARKEAQERGETPDSAPPSAGDLSAAYQMLEDMRWVYKNASVDGKTGRKRLQKLMESDREFMTMVKELMKIESALLSARIRKEGDGGLGGGQGFFVILKGLESDNDVLKNAGDGTIDMKQVAHVLDPSAGRYEAEGQVKEEALPETPQEG
jgi:hypothetical protein